MKTEYIQKLKNGIKFDKNNNKVPVDGLKFLDNEQRKNILAL